MRTLICQIVVIITLISCNSNNNIIPKSDLKVGRVYGPASQITVMSYWTKTEGKVIKVGEGSRMSISDYNEAGNIICQRYYNSGNELKDSTMYIYDVYDRLVRSSRFEKAGKTEDIMYFWNGRKVTKKCRNEYIGELEYDKDGNLIYSKRLRSDGEFEISKLKYDKFGREIESSESYHGKTSHIKYIYKKRGKVEYDYISDLGVTTHYYFIEYQDKYFNPTWSVKIDNKGKASGAMKYIIKYRK